MAGPAPTISHEHLMLATTGTLFSKPGWLYELKYDGFRYLVVKQGERVLSRNGNDMSECFPEIVADVRALERDVVLDSEIGVPMSSGVRNGTGL